MKSIFVIDDTGSPGNKSESLTLKSDRKTYVSVFINENIRNQLELEIKSLLCQYTSKLVFKNLNEFHFTDLINRRKQYANLNPNDVINVFKDFTDILNRYPLPFFIQTITPRTLEENGLKNNLNKTLDEIALDFLFCRIKNHIVTNKLENKIEIVIDEGIKKRGQKAKIKILEDVMDDNFMLFESSHDIFLLQVADFFAFTLNRNQMLMIKEKRTEFDIIILNLLNSVFTGNESSGSKAKLVHSDTFTRVDYDQFQIEYFKKMGVYEFWKKKNS